MAQQMNALKSADTFSNLVADFKKQRRVLAARRSLHPETRARLLGYSDAAGYAFNNPTPLYQPSVDLSTTHREMSLAAAKEIAGLVRAKPNAVLGWLTGGTPLPLYEELKQMHRQGLSFAGVKTFNLDEYLGLPPIHPQSYNRYMWGNFFQDIDIKPANVHIPNGVAQNPEEECAAYEAAIRSAGEMDIQVLGISRNGHIGFCEPGTPFNTRTHVARLTEETRDDNAIYFPNRDSVPTHAITMGPATILRARKIVLLANGSAKREAIYNLRHSSVKPEIPATVLRRHQDVTLFLDKDALVRAQPRLARALLSATFD